MTTIMIGENHIGWDSQIDFGTEKFDYGVPKVTVDADGIWARAGGVSLTEHAVKLLKSGACLAETDNFLSHCEAGGGFEVLRMWRVCTLSTWEVRFWSENTPHGFTPPLPLAMGSGGPLAMGAYLGSDGDVRKTMEIACKMDQATGGKITIASLDVMKDEHDKLRRWKTSK